MNKSELRRQLERRAIDSLVGYAVPVVSVNDRAKRGVAWR